ncbi:lipase/thioesterase [Cordyceps militaris CM01]|uniref:Lipase/thioesterase n=1 Tax=Cordyceps militaris (strain CM01) TaxID=983644 RepID=G3J6V0_CORMM|nr:lipase/thioesterase [Cordyceps militaris CM01]EGX96227.1 lipase/thioesterase [Cordyceps militaris CM01]
MTTTTGTTTRSRSAKAAAAPSTPPPVKIEQKKLSFFGYLDMIPGLAVIVATALTAFVTGLFRTERDSKTFHLHVANTILRKSTSRLTPLQLQLVSPNTDIIYNTYARARKLKPETVALAHGAKGHWVGNKNATNVLIWYHGRSLIAFAGKTRIYEPRANTIPGGGFCLPANIGYFKLFERLLKEVNATGGDLCVFAVTYTLAPHGTYPVQLTQSVEALRHVLEHTGRSPANVLLGGDSAGGNLTVGVLSHLAHPHPSIVPLHVSEPLAGAAAIAPWVSLKPDLSDQVIYDGGDIVTTFVGEQWSTTFMGGAESDYYTDAFDAPSSWFETFPVKKMLFMGGENEIMMPLIEHFYGTVKAGFPNVELFKGKRESHVAPVYNIYVGDNTETEQGKKLKTWVIDLLK